MLYLGKFRNILPFNSGERVNFVELQGAKLTKNGDFHKRDVADVIFTIKGRLMR